MVNKNTDLVVLLVIWILDLHERIYKLSENLKCKMHVSVQFVFAEKLDFAGGEQK